MYPWDEKKGGYWVPLATGFTTRSDAEWAVAQWKMENKITADPFRYREVATPQQVEARDEAAKSMLDCQFNTSPTPSPSWSWPQ